MTYSNKIARNSEFSAFSETTNNSSAELSSNPENVFSNYLKTEKENERKQKGSILFSTA